jgi:hypothetical protein
MNRGCRIRNNTETWHKPRYCVVLCNLLDICTEVPNGGGGSLLFFVCSRAVIYAEKTYYYVGIISLL